jgi:uncharacterized membrane protein YhhN
VSTPITFLLMTFLVAAQLLIERAALRSRWPYGIAKVLASVTFVAYGIQLVLVGEPRATMDGIAPPLGAGRAAGAGGQAGDVALLAALCFSFLGDVLLVPRGRRGFFLAGLVAFLAGHVAYSVAFVLHGIEAFSFGLCVAVAVVVIVVVVRWLRPSLVGVMKKAVPAYVVVICAMLCTAVAAVVSASTDGRVHPGPLVVVGALFFWASDLMVARERFVRAAWIHRVLGIPLYFFAQLLLVYGMAG